MGRFRSFLVLRPIDEWAIFIGEIFFRLGTGKEGERAMAFWNRGLE